jgi:predicted phosphodiesterase
MKYLMFGDIHGEDPSKLERVIDEDNTDCLICLGDFDQTKSINKFLDMKEKYEKIGVQIIDIPGNHDHAILNNLIIGSGTLLSQEKELDWEDEDVYEKIVNKFHNNLKKDKRAFEYIEKLVNSDLKKEIYLDENKFGKEYKTIIVHGGLNGNLRSYPTCPKEIKNLWYRIENIDDKEFNFNEMNLNDYKIMIVGHEHFRDYVHRYIENGKEKIDEPNPRVEEEFELKEGQHIINPGPLFYQYYATIDTNKEGKDFPIVKFSRL